MYLCFVDESGDCQTITGPTCTLQPLIVIGALFIDADKVKPLTTDFLALKRRFYPNLYQNIRHDLDLLRKEIKGCDIRNFIRNNNLKSGVVKHSFRFLDSIFALVNQYSAHLVGRIWIKQIGQPFNDQSIYTITTQGIAERFQSYLWARNSEGMIIADFRDPKRNSYVSHSIFTQKHKKKHGGDAYPNINETAVFGMSDNHACLQIVDILCSSIIFPSAARVYSYPTIRSMHTHGNYDAIRARYKRKLKKLQYNFTSNSNRFWGITVRDCIHNYSASSLFR